MGYEVQGEYVPSPGDVRILHRRSQAERIRNVLPRHESDVMSTNCFLRQSQTRDTR